MATTAPHIDTERNEYGIRVTCRLCGNYGTGHGYDGQDDVDNWIAVHTEECTPDTVRQQAAGLLAAVEVIRTLAHDGHPALWEEGDGRFVTTAIIDRLRGRALELKVAADTAEACPGCGLIDPNGVHDGTCEVAADEKLPPFAAKPEPEPDLTVYQASHDSIVMRPLYTTAAAARAHCEADTLRDLPGVSLDWIEDDEDGVAELMAAVGAEERSTGFVVTPLTAASAYDAEAAERQTA